jgi:hypothetical protein
MKTEINNSLRVYQVITTAGNQFFCNIEQLNYIINSECKQGEFKIFHFWNNKAKKVSKKDLKSFFEGSQLKQEFNY